MSIKVRVSRDVKEPIERTYPYIGALNGSPDEVVVLFEKLNTGVVLKGKSFGSTFSIWDESQFGYFRGEVVLEQGVE